MSGKCNIFNLEKRYSFDEQEKVKQHVNKKELEDVHYIRQAYNLPCGTCVYSEYCKRVGINKNKFRERVIDNV